MTNAYAKQLTRVNFAGRCTDRVRAAMRHANVAAGNAGLDRINSLHIIIGLFHEGGSWASLSLKLVDLDPAKLLQASAGGRFESADAVFDRACVISDEQEHGYVGTDHLLLAVLDGQDSACETLGIAGVNVGKLREALRSAAGRTVPPSIQEDEVAAVPFDRDAACRQFVDGLLLRMSWDRCRPLDMHEPFLGKHAVDGLCKLAETLKANGESWEEYT